MTIQTLNNNLSQPLNFIPHAKGRAYSGPYQGTTGSTGALTANLLYATLVMIPKANTYYEMGCSVTSAAASGKLFRLGIYRDKYYTDAATDGGYPYDLVKDFGTVLADATGARKVSLATGVYLTPGWYWLALVTDGTPTCDLYNTTNNGLFSQLGYTSNTDTTFKNGWTVSFTFAALPNPFTGGGAVANSMPIVMLRL